MSRRSFPKVTNRPAMRLPMRTPGTAAQLVFGPICKPPVTWSPIRRRTCSLASPTAKVRRSCVRPCWSPTTTPIIWARWWSCGAPFVHGRTTDRSRIRPTGQSTEPQAAPTVRLPTMAGRGQSRRRSASMRSTSEWSVDSEPGRWEAYFDLVRVQDAHSRNRCRDLNGTEPWACGDCDCSARLETKLATEGETFLDSLRTAVRNVTPSPETGKPNVG